MTIESSNKTRPFDTLKGICFSSYAKTSFKNITIECDFSDDVVLAITDNLLNLEKLSLRQATGKTFSKKHFSTLFKNLVNLKELSIELYSAASDFDLYDEIEMDDVNITYLQQLRKINFDGFSNCPEIDLKKLYKLSKLENICYNNIINEKVTL